MKNKINKRSNVRGKIGWVFAKMPSGVCDIAQTLQTVGDAFEQARNEYGGLGSPLVFTEKALRKAADSPFKRPGEVLRHLKTLHRFAVLWADGNRSIGMSWKAWFKQNGINTYRPEVSQTSLGDYGNEYCCFYEGVRFVGEDHFTIGSGDANTCLSIHFAPDLKRGKILVTHCGRHLSNTQS